MNEKVVEILLVEDNPTDVELTLRAFKKNNITNSVHVSKDGQDALDFIFAHGKYADRAINFTPKVILLDLQLPKVSGMEVLRRIKSDERTKLVPVVVLSSSKEEQDLIESYKLGVNSYITKPIDFENFSKAVSTVGYYWTLFNQPPL